MQLGKKDDLVLAAYCGLNVFQKFADQFAYILPKKNTDNK